MLMFIILNQVPPSPQVYLLQVYQVQEVSNFLDGGKWMLVALAIAVKASKGTFL